MTSYFKNILSNYKDFVICYTVEIPDNFGGSCLIYFTRNLNDVKKFVESWYNPNYKNVNNKDFLQINLLICNEIDDSIFDEITFVKNFVDIHETYIFLYDEIFGEE